MENCLTSELIHQRLRSANYLGLLFLSVLTKVENASSIIQSRLYQSDTSNEQAIPDAVNPILTSCGSCSTSKQTEKQNRRTRRTRYYIVIVNFQFNKSNTNQGLFSRDNNCTSSSVLSWRHTILTSTLVRLLVSFAVTVPPNKT